MNTIHFTLTTKPKFPDEAEVEIWVDGMSLIEHVRRLEGPWWAKIGRPQPEGQYIWVPAHTALLPSRHLLGDPAVPWADDYCPVIRCNCGEYACRCYAVKIELSSDKVIWSAWKEIPPEEARLGELLGQMTFLRSQYEAELLRVSEQYRPDFHGRLL